MEGDITYVSSPDDPRIEVYRDVKGRDIAGRGDLFLLEGANSIQNLVNYGRMPLVSVCLSEKRIEAMKELLRVVLALGVPVYAVPQGILEEVVGFHFHRGVLGCGRKLPAKTPREFLTDDGPIILCEHMNNLDNVGAVFRNAAALGAKGILFDKQSSDPYYRKSLRVSGGHALAVPFTRSGTIIDIIRAVKDADFSVLALVTPHTKCSTVSIVDYVPKNKRFAILVGAEGPGLSDDAIKHADVCITIPMAPDVDSLNVATTAAIALFHLTSRVSRPPRRPFSVTLLLGGALFGGLLSILLRSFSTSTTKIIRR